LKEDRSFGALLAGASAIKTATLLGVSRATVPSLCRRTRFMGRKHQRRGTVCKRQKSTLTKRESRTFQKDCFEESQNYCSAGYGAAELNIHLEALFLQKLSNLSYTNPTSTVGLQLRNL
jgi:hypothetical protein